MNRAVDTDRFADTGSPALVVRARGGDRQATAELIAAHLPLVYNIVGRALSGHADTDDVVQETMLRAVDGLPGLRDPAGFRSWLVAIAMNQVRRRYRDSAPAGPDGGLHDAYDMPDPSADFVGLTIVRLGLSEQRREVAEATRWLDDDERQILSLWWLEAAGELTRAELAAAAELSPQHAAVRVQRVKEQLETARAVVRALAFAPRCWQLAELTARWNGVPSPLWRKRISRHTRECGYCWQAREGLVPAEGLLAGIAMVPLPSGYGEHLGLAKLAAFGPSGSGSGGGSGYGSGHGSGGAHRAGGRRRPKARGRGPLKVLGAAVLTATVAGVTAGVLPDYGPRADLAEDTPAATRVDLASAPDVQRSAETPSSPAPATTSAAPSPSAAPSTPAPSPTPTARPSSPKPATTQAVPPSGDTVQQVLDLVNAERAKAGCGPVKANAQLQTAAQRHSDDMAARGFFDHNNPDGAGPQERIDASGYKWSTWGENIARGQQDAAAVMDAWMHSDGHRANILNCTFTELGIGVHTGKGGPWWTQDFGTPPH
ncbi:sigma-70 family RNA polymerase sigma factor [Kitasatospora sp. NPDC088346]|uniref:sigma-70 family RNA polymerase sigma factor n=1 Tax=Kitasatospora sp. NPDC088346 TaxID=3364073 RepID=UPI00382F7ECB